MKTITKIVKFNDISNGITFLSSYKGESHWWIKLSSTTAVSIDKIPSLVKLFDFDELIVIEITYEHICKYF